MYINAKIKVLFLVVHFCITILGVRQCLLEELRLRKYHKVKACRRSQATITSQTNVRDLSECISYAREKKGLAFNFSPFYVKDSRINVHNCQVLGCPETANLTTLVKDAAFDYYSSYGNYSALDNSHCIKSIGMFRLIDVKENYSTAIDQCQKLGGDLAHILSESRTNALSNLVSNFVRDWYKVAFVGLDDTRREGLFETPLGDPITCYRFRAWGPGQPRNVMKSDDCVVLDSKKTWKVISCSHTLPFLCEYYPSSAISGSYEDVDCDDLDDSEQGECITDKRKTNRIKRRCY
ncbi:PREDICTED: uncharacterized protein LOC108560683 isoform X2 [Nicrophorus vespilloides]|uniref:Uncharacterized protein LOC108560683 isoform X2 n=1 Tax=Nicrophorus vespilloides TaxID=110193 RepID=A0ABM1MGX8_NICVS|nr:PREDICTED: uncharacterized protein LOC108560683 isoform X2 [Nicrophorus vespilloides]